MVFLINKRVETEAPHANKGPHQFDMDVTLLMLLVLALFGLMPIHAKANTLLPNDARQAVFKKHLPHLSKYESCIVETVNQTKLPEMLLLSILLQENGRTGRYSVNRNKTKDYGLGQINDVRKQEIANIGLTMHEVLTDGCKNIIAVAYLLSNEFKKADGQLWTAVGNYHYSKYGPHPNHHYSYIKKVHAKWATLYETVKATVRST